jgi:hypothetical protein
MKTKYSPQKLPQRSYVKRITRETVVLRWMRRARGISTHFGIGDSLGVMAHPAIKLMTAIIGPTDGLMIMGIASQIFT